MVSVGVKGEIEVAGGVTVDVGFEQKSACQRQIVIKNDVIKGGAEGLKY